MSNRGAQSGRRTSWWIPSCERLPDPPNDGLSGPARRLYRMPRTPRIPGMQGDSRFLELARLVDQYSGTDGIHPTAVRD